MKKVVKVNGMNCNHCEMHVQDAIEELDGVLVVKADHNTGTVEIEYNKEVPDDMIKTAVEEAGYEFAQ